MQGWTAGLAINYTAASLASPDAPSGVEIAQSVGDAFSSSDAYNKAFGELAASLAQAYGVPVTSVLGLVAVQVRAVVLHSSLVFVVFVCVTALCFIY